MGWDGMGWVVLFVLFCDAFVHRQHAECNVFIHVGIWLCIDEYSDRSPYLSGSKWVIGMFTQYVVHLSEKTRASVYDRKGGIRWGFFFGRGRGGGGGAGAGGGIRCVHYVMVSLVCVASLDAGFMGYWVLLAGWFSGCEVSCALSFF